LFAGFAAVERTVETSYRAAFSPRVLSFVDGEVVHGLADPRDITTRSNSGQGTSVLNSAAKLVQLGILQVR